MNVVAADALDQLDGSTRPLRVGLVGVGLVGQAGHVLTLTEDRARFDVVAVIDPSPSARSAVARRFGLPRTCATLTEAIPLGLDAVVVAVPDPAHLPVCLEALAAGLHVFCEKPLVQSVADAERLIAARGDRVLQVGYMKLYDPAVERMVELLQGSEPVYLSVEVNDPDQAPFVDHLGLFVARDVPAELVEQTREVTAGAVHAALGRPGTREEARAFEAYLSALVHDVSLVHHLLAAAGARAPLPLTDAAWFDAGRGVSLTWALPAGGEAHLVHLNLPGVSDYTERVTAFCRDRILELTFPSPYLRHHPARLVEKRSVAGNPAGLTVTEHRVSYEEAFRNELRAFHASVTTGAPVRATAETARDDLAALIGAFRIATGVDPRDTASTSPHTAGARTSRED
jgi:predicted dehydrogenase